MKFPWVFRFAKYALIVALLAPLSTHAQVLFNRVDIQIHPAPPAPTRDGETTIIRPTLKYDTEVRTQDALRLEYIHTLNTLTDTTGVMITFNQPSLVSLPYMKVSTPVDALFVANDGTIVEILPGAVLGNIAPNIGPNIPIKAFLFLKNGQAAARHIAPRDTIVGNMFTPALPIQQ